MQGFDAVELMIRRIFVPLELVVPKKKGPTDFCGKKHLFNDDKMIKSATVLVHRRWSISENVVVHACVCEWRGKQKAEINIEK